MKNRNPANQRLTLEWRWRTYICTRGWWSMLDPDDNVRECACIFTYMSLCGYTVYFTAMSAFWCTCLIVLEWHTSRFVTFLCIGFWDSENVCSLCVCVCVCVGMQQAYHSIAVHVSSMIANRLPPQSSVWKINSMLFLPFLSHYHTHTPFWVTMFPFIQWIWIFSPNKWNYSFTTDVHVCNCMAIFAKTGWRKDIAGFCFTFRYTENLNSYELALVFKFEFGLNISKVSKVGVMEKAMRWMLVKHTNYYTCYIQLTW